MHETISTLSNDKMAGSDSISILNELLAQEPDESYWQLSERLRQARRVFHECVAKQMEIPFNEQLKTLPNATYEDKKQLALFANREMRAMGVGILCPRSGEVSALVAGTAEHSGVGRFRLSPLSDESRRPFSSVDLCSFSLTPHYERRESRSERKFGR